MTIAATITVAVVLGILLILATTRIAPDLVFLAGLAILLVSGVLDPAEAFAGFSNEGVLTVGILYAVVSGLRDTGGLHWISRRLLGRPTTLGGALLRLTVPVSFLSAFLNITPIVAMMIPAVREWGRAMGFSASKLLMPLSFAAILGGTITLIGTSTNLVVNGLLVESGLGRLGMFDLARIGLPATVLGLAFIVLARRLLPDRTSLLAQAQNPREYSIEMTVIEGGPLDGKTLEAAGLKNLPTLYLLEIERDGAELAPVTPQLALQGNDRLVFVGAVEDVVELQKMNGLSPATNQILKLDTKPPGRILVEAVVSNSFPLLYRRIRESRFRSIYGAVVIAVARNGERMKIRTGEVIPRPGDTLLLAATPEFVERNRNSRDFYLVSPIPDSEPPNFERAAAALMFPIAMSVAQGVGDDPVRFAIAIAIGASASFATPFGYQTNLMIYGPGGYTFRDYFVLGFPLTLIVLVVLLLFL